MMGVGAGRGATSVALRCDEQRAAGSCIAQRTSVNNGDVLSKIRRSLEQKSRRQECSR